jgi:hypothetical protein
VGREVRRVAADWRHPLGENGKFQPIHAGEMPNWKVNQATHYQMYETYTAGTPISPVMEYPEALARWLVANKASAFGYETACYEAWLQVCRGDAACAFAIDKKGKIVSGVEHAYQERKKSPSMEEQQSLRKSREDCFQQYREQQQTVQRRKEQTVNHERS